MKELPIPERLLAAEALERRLIKGHPLLPEIQSDVARRRAGYRGEMVLDYYVKKLPQQQYYIFHDLELKIEEASFQIDTLLLSQYFNLLIETKNISGILTFETAIKQLIRENGGKDEAFEDPRIQAEYHQILLNRWFSRHNLNLLPLEHLVFFSSVKTILKIKPSDTSDFSRICKARELFLKINYLENRYPNKKADIPTIEKMGKYILSQHSPQPFQILKDYLLSTNDIATGVRCPKCAFLPMAYHRRKCTCPACGHISNEAIHEAIHDYFYLYKPFITNSELRHFLHLPTADISQKILQSSNLNSSGSTKNRIYFK